MRTILRYYRLTFHWYT